MNHSVSVKAENTFLFVFFKQVKEANSKRLDVSILLLNMSVGSTHQHLRVLL